MLGAREVTGWKGVFSPNARRVLAYLRPERARLWTIALLGLLYIPLSLVEPYLLFYLTDRVLLAGRPDLLAPFFLRFVPYFVLAMSVEFLLTYTLLSMARDLHHGVKSVQLDNLLAKGANFFRNTASGKILFSFFNDSNQIGALLSLGAVNAMLNLFFAAARLAILAYLDVKLMCVYLAVIPPQALVLYRVMKVAMRMEIKLKSKDEELTARIESLLRGAVVVKAFGFAGALADVWKRLFASRLDLDFRNLMWKQLGSVGITGIQAVGVFLVLFIGAHEVADGTLTLGTLLAFVAVGGRVAPSIQALIGFLVGIQEGLVNIERFYRIYDIPDETRQLTTSAVSEGALACRMLADEHLREIHIRHVLVDHGNGAAIRVPCDFAMRWGQRYLWYGPNGAGKTSVALALAGLVPHSHGSILCGTIPLSEFSPLSVRHKILYVGSDPFWPEQTLEDNFLNGDRAQGLDPERLREALWVSTGDEVLASLPRGMRTVLSDNGHILSRGENQRLFLAMVLYRRPSLMILDESLSNVSERLLNQIAERLRALSFECLVVHVSQRRDHLSLVENHVVFGAVG